MAYSIEALSEGNVHQWEDFNNHCREGTLFHGLQWKNVLEDIFTLKLRYYLIRNDENVIGIWPFMEQTAGYSRGLVGIPHSEQNNMILDDSFNPEHINDVLALFSGEYSFLHFNTYDPDICGRIRYDNFTIENTGNMILNLKQKPPDAIWNTFSKKMRYDIRIFSNQGYEMQEVHRASDMKDFYRYYTENLKYINGEILPCSFFERLLDAFSPDNLRIAVLTSNDIFAGGSVALVSTDRKTAYFEYIALNRALPNRYSPSGYIAWEGINWAWNKGYEKISFGRQKLDQNNPRFSSKTKFGAEHIPIHSRTVILSKTAALLYRIKQQMSRGRNV